MGKFLFVLLFFTAAFISCDKPYEGSPGVGGGLTSNFIAVKDSGFSPMVLKVVNGSTITFVNNTTSAKTLQSADSIIIPKTTIPAGGSYLFKKDTTASFQYYIVSKPTIQGTINLTQ